MSESPSRSQVARRNFLRQGRGSHRRGGGGAVGHGRRPRQGGQRRLGVGFIGVGGRAHAHMKVINDLKQQGLVEPVAVCDIYRPRREEASRITGGAKMYVEHQALLADPNVDVVCVATPDHLHAPLTIDALNAGKDVYCEKPLTHWSQFELAKQVQEAADRTGVWCRWARSTPPTTTIRKSSA